MIIQTSHCILAMIAISVVCLGLAWFFMLRYLRRLKIVRTNQQQLEELLYYDQVSKLHTNAPVLEPLSPAIKKLQLNRELFIAELKRGLAQNQFILHYQPIMHTHHGRIDAVEALIRWQHPVYGLLNPSVFLPLCEQTGFIIPLGEWIIQHACQQIRKWHEMGYAQLSMSINLSARQLDHARLLDCITESLTLNACPAHCLQFEITEDSLMNDFAMHVALLKSLRQLGVQLALDDFGTGYSSLKYLKQLPISHLKIDKTFIHDMTTNITSLGIVESVIALGKSLGLTITAEGVLNNHQLHLLKKMGCDLIQGYLYSKPISAAQMTELLQASKHSHALLYDAQYQYAVLSEVHSDQVVDLLSQTCCEQEPMTHYLKITPQEFLPFAKRLAEKAIQDGLSLVALDSNKVVACTIVEDMADPLNMTAVTDVRFKMLFSFLENVGHDFFRDRTLDKGHIAHLFMTAVNKEYHHQGLTKKINFESIRLAKEKGFDFMCCEFTHAHNEKDTIKSLQNSRLHIRSSYYKDFIFEGNKPFAQLEGHASAYIWELREGAQLRYRINISDSHF